MCYKCSWLLSSSNGHLVLCLYTSLLTVSVFHYRQYLGVTLTRSEAWWPHSAPASRSGGLGSSPGAHFSKAPETFQARKAIVSNVHLYLKRER